MAACRAWRAETHADRNRLATDGDSRLSFVALIWAICLVLISSRQVLSVFRLDLIGARSLTPTPVLVSLLWQDRYTLAGVDLFRCLILSACGAPFTFYVGCGSNYAPVAHARAVVLGTAPLRAALPNAGFPQQWLGLQQVASVPPIPLVTLAIVLRHTGIALRMQPLEVHASVLSVPTRRADTILAIPVLGQVPDRIAVRAWVVVGAGLAVRFWPSRGRSGNSSETCGKINLPMCTTPTKDWKS